ncbi:MAG: aminotransferase class IV, partial [Candidatus Omnitrophota bacterium]
KKYQPYSLRKYQEGIALAVSSFRQNENSLLARIKSTSRLLHELSYAEAKRKGFAGSLILNNRGYITEASNSNAFFIKDRFIFTPALACGCLDGITRRVIFDLAGNYNFKVEEGNFTLRDLYAAEEVFLTNSLAGIMPVASLNGKIIGKGRCGRITRFFIEKYKLLF